MIDVLRGPWNERWFIALEGFPPPISGRGHDDDADSTARAFNAFLEPVKGAAFLEIARRHIAARDALRANVSTNKPEWQPGSMEYAAEQAEAAAIAKAEADAAQAAAPAEPAGPAATA